MNDKLDRSVELSDPRALRALAHPTRLKLVGLLRRAGPLTATQAGNLIGESAASCSFHFRQLARWGLVEESGGGRGRERPWRATARHTSWKITKPELAEPSAALSGLVVRQQFELLMDAVGRLPAESAEWQKAYQIGDTTVELTPSELDELGRRVWEIVRSYETHRGDGDRGGGDRGTEKRRRVGIFFAGYLLAEGDV